MMVNDPLSELTLDEYASALRNGNISATDVAAQYLKNIDLIDDRLGSYADVFREGALKHARAIDECLRCGVDLGPLMGFPVAIKDIFAIEGTKTAAGSKLECDDLVAGEGSFVSRLKRAGCIILGKTHTTEFAFSPSGINRSTRTPRNPSDADEVRIPGGSSSGSAVALAAGLCAFSVGSDTGGSVRVPAALNGIVGLKTTVGLWPTDGVFSLSTTLDSIGLFARSVRDMILLFSALEGVRVHEPPPGSLRLGVAREYFFEDLDSSVRGAMDRAVSAFQSAGIALTDVALPEARERAPMSSKIMATELLATFGRDRLLSQIDKVDGAVQARVREFSTVSADEYVRLIRRHRMLTATINERLETVDAWISPSVACVAPALSDLESVEAQAGKNFLLTRNSQPINVFGQCAISVPIPGSDLPVGLQVACAPGQEKKLLGIAATLERVLGVPARRNLDHFARSQTLKKEIDG